MRGEYLAVVATLLVVLSAPVAAVTTGGGSTVVASTNSPATNDAVVEPLGNTSPLDANNTEPESLASEVRVETGVAANASAETVGTDVDPAEREGSTTLRLDVDEANDTAENITTYVDAADLAGYGVSDVSVAVNGTEANVTTATDGNTTWYGVNVPNAANTIVQVAYAVDLPGYVADLPAGVVPVNETAEVGGEARVEPVEFSGKTRVNEAVADDTTVDLIRDDDTNMTVDVGVPEGTDDATFYVMYDRSAGSAAPENVTVTVDGEPVEFGVVEAEDEDDDNTTWLGVALNDSDDTVSVYSPEGTLAPPERDEDDDGGAPGPREELPDSFADFGPETEPGAKADLTGVEPGMVRIEEGYASDTTIELVRNDRTNFTLDIEVTGDAENVTFYLNTNAIQASQHIEGLEAYVDGEETVFGEVTNARGGWIAFEVDHFSERRITFETESNVSQPIPGTGAAAPPNNLDGDTPHEDVNGDGRANFLDVVDLLFADEERINSEFSDTELSTVDFNDDGRFGFLDVITRLFEG